MLNPIYSYIMLGVIGLVVIGIYLYFFLVVYAALANCEASESSYCPLMYCNDPIPQCGNYPWRPDPVTGAPICSQYLLTLAAPTAGTKTST